MPTENLIEAIVRSVLRILDEPLELLTPIGSRSHRAIPAKPLPHSPMENTKEKRRTYRENVHSRKRRKTFAPFPAPRSPSRLLWEVHTSNQAPDYDPPCGEEKRPCRKHDGEAMVTRSKYRCHKNPHSHAC